MRILFICSALEEGKDGIGDYTHNLAQECLVNGVLPMIVAINDEYISQKISGISEGVPYHRFPDKLSWKEKSIELLKILNNDYAVDWISIQFQPYGFSDKGIVWQAALFFHRLKLGKTHVMMHELWVAEENEASLKMKFLGMMQKWSILFFLKKLKPAIVQTSIPLYNKILNIAGIKSTLLPLFSNIQYKESQTESHKVAVSTILESHGDSIVACLFGSIYHDSWDLSSLFTILKQQKEQLRKQVFVVSIGKISFGHEFWNGLATKYPDINFLTLGPRDEGFISYWLTNYVDFGVVTTPAIIAGKSGSCMAFLEHGVPVVCKQNNFSFNFEIDKTLIDNRIIQISNSGYFKIPERAVPSQQLKHTTLQLIKTLNSFN